MILCRRIKWNISCGCQRSRVFECVRVKRSCVEFVNVLSCLYRITSITLRERRCFIDWICLHFCVYLSRLLCRMWMTHFCSTSCVCLRARPLPQHFLVWVSELSEGSNEDREVLSFPAWIMEKKWAPGTCCPLHFGMFLLSTLLSILAKLVVLPWAAKKTSGPLKIQNQSQFLQREWK